MMSTITGNLRRVILSGAIGVAAVFAVWGTARADVASDKPGAILVFPKVVVDTQGVFGAPTDTEIQISNTTASHVVAARCYWANATSHCSATKAPCTATDTHLCSAGEVCVADSNCAETDFKMTLTKRQPILFTANQGLLDFPLDGINKFGPDGQSNRGSDGSPSSVLPVPEDPFIGELKCVEVDPTTFLPTIGFDPANGFTGDLKGEATIVRVDTDGDVDARKYNAIGIQSTGTQNSDLTLVIGGPTPEYNGCPKTLILNHLFDDAEVSTSAGLATVDTDITFVACSEDFNLQQPGGAVLQFLVFNEFEQRFSTSTRFTCFDEVQLSDIDTRPGPAGNAQSIFNIGVEGTLGGQTRIRPVEGATVGNGVLAVSESFWSCGSGPGGVCGAASNVHFTGTTTNPDQLILSPEP